MTMVEQQAVRGETWDDLVNQVSWRTKTVDQLRWRDDVERPEFDMSDARNALLLAQRDTHRRMRPVVEVIDHLDGGTLSPFLLQDRKKLKGAIALAQSQELTPQQVIDKLGVTAEDVALYRTTRKQEQTRKRRIAAAAAVGVMGLIALRHGGGDKSVQASTVAPVIAATPAPAPSLPPVTVAETIPSTTIAEATTTVPVTEPAPVVTTPPTTVTTAPAKPTFDQRHYGKVESIVVVGIVDTDEVQRINQITGDGYTAPTLTAFNGQKTDGQSISFKDCPANGALINYGESASEFAAAHGLTIGQLYDLNGGQFNATAGWCGRTGE